MADRIEFVCRCLRNVRTFLGISVTGNVEGLVMPLSAGTDNLNVANAPVTARGGLAIVGGQSQQTMALTDAIRSGQSAPHALETRSLAGRR